ncbi:MAG: amino acid adenylation domain-containing protein, partial [Hamadaea sp.]|nr:amino acid adenylation domain-containing protein [Hamadaea sp.]
MRTRTAAVTGTARDRFADVVAAMPDAAAVYDGGVVTTYAELDRRSDEIAGWLCDRGIGAEDVVAVAVGRTVHLPVCVLGVWKAGAAYLALDPLAPRERWRSILEQVRPAAALAEAGFRRRLSGLEGSVALVDRAISARRPTPGGCDARNLAYVIHTSGSTGRPKAVAISQGSLLALVDSYRRLYRMGDEVKRVLQLAGFGFDVATGDLARTLLTGGCLVMCPDETLTSPPDLVRLVDDSAAEYLELTPSLLRPLVRHLATTGDRLDSVRHVIVGGELWSADEYREARDVFGPKVALFNTYGLTEATIDNTYFQTDPDTAYAGSVPIGADFASTGLAVLDGELRETGEGELYLSGVQLARGYLGDPAATAARFVPGPDGTRRYRTGDLVRFDDHGALVHLGRADDVVKVHGVRLSLVEVQLVLAACPGVAAAAVAGEEVGGRRELVAYLVAADDLDVAQLRRFVATRLPRAMVPAVVAVVPQFPVTPNGKVDLAALGRQRRRSADVEADDPAGADLAAGVRRIWARVLDTAAPAPDDDFFEHGGDSLRAAMFVAAVRAELGVEVAPGTLLERPTLGEVVAAVARSAASSAIVPDPNRTTGPLAPGQQRLWLLNQLDGLAAYNIPVVLGLAGDVDPAIVAGALHHLVTRHPALRTAFVAGAGGPEQRIAPAPAQFPLHLLTLPDAGSAEDWIAAEVRRPFDLTRPPLLRAALISLGQGEHRLVLTLHHLVSDAQTVRVLLTEFGEACRALRAGNIPASPEPALSYLDYSVWYADRLGAGEYEPQLRSWTQRLDGCPPAYRFPAPLAPAAESGPEIHRRTLDPNLTADLRVLAREHRTTLFVVLLTALAGVLRRWAGEEDQVIGVPLGTRTVAGTEDLAGFFVDTAAIRVTAPETATFADLVRVTRAAIAHATANQAIPFDVVHHHLRRAGTDVSFSTWFNFLGDPDPAPEIPGLKTWVIDQDPVGPLFDFNVYVTDFGGHLGLTVIHDPATVDGRVAAAFVDQFAALLSAVADRPDRPVNEHPLASTPLDEPRQPVPARAVLESFADRVRDAGAAIAITDQSGAVTYAELAAWASAIAAQLARHVSPGDRVAVYAPRSRSLVAGLLVSWAAGTDFTILDPGHPQARLRAQLEAAGGTAAILFSGTAPTFGDRFGPTIAIDPIRAGGALSAPSRPAGHVGFTSGTTGSPKPVRASGVPLAHFLDVYAAGFGLDAADRFAMLSGLAHDPLLRDVFAPLTVGASVRIPPDEFIRSPRDLHAWLDSEEVTVAHVTPQLLRMITTVRRPLPRLRVVLCGGDQLFAADVAALRAVAPSVTVVNAYGTTETPQVAAWYRVGPDDRIGGGERRIPIGVGVDGTDVRVTRADGHPAAVGERGEIVVRSAYLADGYGPEYATGDLGRYLPGGVIELLGRADDRVNVAGFRVEPQEVDAAMRALGYIADCRTVTSAGRLIAYVVTAEGETVSVAKLRGDLRTTLPPHLIPAGVVEMAALPLSRNGKLDRDALPPWRPGDGIDGHTVRFSRLERQIADVWREVLQCAPDLDSNFFDLGGSSLLMLQTQIALEDRLGFEVPMLTLFELSTVRALAAHLAGGAAAAPGVRATRTPIAVDASRRQSVRAKIR